MTERNLNPKQACLKRREEEKGELTSSLSSSQPDPLAGKTTPNISLVSDRKTPYHQGAVPFVSISELEYHTTIDFHVVR